MTILSGKLKMSAKRAKRPVSCEKVSQTFVSNTEKIARLIGEEIW